MRRFPMLTLPLVLTLAPLGVGACGKAFEQEIGTAGDTMAYDVTSFTVRAGQKVHVVLKNHGHTSAMVHNFVLVQPGTEQSVATGVMEAGLAANYVKVGDPNVLASSPLSQPGTTTEVTFTAPSKGKYPYICTFPGHYTTMKGTLNVE